MKNVLHPITVARRVMERTEHCLLVGEGAQKFIEKENISTVPTEDLLTSRELGKSLLLTCVVLHILYTNRIPALCRTISAY